MTRVLLVHQPTDGGVGRHVADLAGGLAARGYEILTCGPAPPGEGDGSWEHLRLDLRRPIRPGDARAIAEMARVLRRVSPDVVHAHSSKAGAVARMANASPRRVPLVYTPHGFAFAGHFKRALERRVYLEAERVLGRLTDRAVCVCEAEARLARRVVRADRVRVVYNGIELTDGARVDRQMETLAREGPVVCTVGLLRAGKGVETLIEATPEILAHHPRTRIAVWGTGPEAGALKAQAASLGVAGAVRFLGATTTPLEVMRGAHVVVMPSWKESFPYVVLEAMAAGVPLVACDVGGVGEAIRGGEEGVLVAPQDASALAGAIASLLPDDQRRARVATAAKRRVGQEFSRTRMLDGHELVYGELLRGR